MWCSLSVSKFYEQDEILKLKAAALKKEESDIQIENYISIYMYIP